MYGFSIRLALLLLCTMAVKAMAAGADQVIVFDVSNSMWGPVDGRTKIEVARQAITDLAELWPESRRIGLVAYGHRRVGDCVDIEELIPVGPMNKAFFTATVNRLKPRGKTPLTAAVRRAAEILNYKDKPATVILVSDGLDNCNADPCALAESLEADGAEFTVHVIGFDIKWMRDQRQLACLAEATGGRFLTAADAQELDAALKQASGLQRHAPAAAELPGVRLEVPEQVRIGASFDVNWSGPQREGDYISIARNGDRVGRYYSHARSLNGSPAGLRAPDYPGTYQVRYVHALSQEIVGSAQIKVVDAVAELESAVKAGIGQIVRVDWRGPDGPQDFIALVRADGEDRSVADSVYTRDGTPTQLKLPDRPGTYEIRYITGQARRVLARRPILVQAVSASLSAADSGRTGSMVAVEWTGPGAQDDFINVVPQNAAEGSLGSYVYARKGSPASLRLPEQPGAYEIRYVSGQTRHTLARLRILVQSVETSLDAAAASTIGAHVQVVWSGPGNRKDLITVVPLGTPERRFGNYIYARDGASVELLMPDRPGDYEIRYLTGKERQILARRSIRVEDVAATLDAPESVAVGSRFEVYWKGPGGRKDYIAINDAGSPGTLYKGYAYTRHGSPLSMEAPGIAGDYELRYVTGQTRRVLARRSLLVGIAAGSE